ncbi:hypothetical protein D3C86_1860780 [compost metagenome]
MHTLRHCLRLRHPGGGQQRQKLLATPAPHHIGCPKNVATQCGKELQRLVAHVVAMLVVHAFEVVDVHHQQAGRFAAALQQGQLLSQALCEGAAANLPAC